MKSRGSIICQLTIVSFFLLLASCMHKETITTLNTPIKHDSFGIYDAPAVRSFPSSPATIQTWIDNMDRERIRAHAWDIWESINTDTLEGVNYPIWETWYTGHELFEMGDSAKYFRHGIRDFGATLQSTFNAKRKGSNPSSISNDEIPINPSERPTSFNRFSRTTAHAIWDKQINRAKILDSINDQFNIQNAAIIEREVLASQDSVDKDGFVLKPLFQFISGTQPTALPYWAGISAFTTDNQERPGPETWRQCVIIDPTNSLEVGSKHKMLCNNQMGEWEVIDINRIYHLKFDETTAKNFSKFAQDQGGDDLGAHNRHERDSIAKMIKPGNYALLMAMHVTGKEIVNWTWQTFWWSPSINQPPFGDDRPSSIKPPWNNYLLQTAYYMVTPPGTKKGGMPHLGYNPYLEANLEFHFQPPGQDSVVVRGVFSNCMTCHRKAVYPFPKKNFYTMAGYIDKEDAELFAGSVKTDFLWSLSIRPLPDCNKLKLKSSHVVNDRAAIIGAPGTIIRERDTVRISLDKLVLPFKITGPNNKEMDKSPLIISSATKSDAGAYTIETIDGCEISFVIDVLSSD